MDWDEEMKALAANQRLAVLDVSDLELTDKSAAALAGMPSLRMLYANKNSFTDEGAVAFSHSRALTFISLLDNKEAFGERVRHFLLRSVPGRVVLLSEPRTVAVMV